MSAAPGSGGMRDRLKRMAAEAAVAEVESGMVLGLGSGSTAEFALAALARRVVQGLRVTGIPTSERCAALARRLGIPLTGFAEHRRLDLVIDGADEVEMVGLDLVKGAGGALLREKIVASAGRRVVIVVDEGKLVDRLGRRAALPVEIAVFGAEWLIERLAAIVAGAVNLRQHNGAPFRTDGGNYIVDCACGEIADPALLDRRLKALPGVVETGLFIGLASRVLVGTPDGVRSLER